MKNRLLFILVFCMSSNLFDQNIYNHNPSKVDTIKIREPVIPLISDH